MGLLDDAIREHLDLKRRRGADPAEVERDEREALGPVRRAPEGPARDDESTEPSASFAYDREREEDSWSHDSAEEEPAAPPRRTDIEEEPTTPSREIDFEEERTTPSRRIDFEQDLMELPEDRKLGGDEPEFELEPDPTGSNIESESASRRRHSADDETIEHDLDDTVGPEQPDEGTNARGRSDDDVLEGTPEFLQDTPDHDRLWFEQRPPKDFDFDG